MRQIASHGVGIAELATTLLAKAGHSQELNTHCKDYFDEAFYGHVSAAGVCAVCEQ